MREYTLKKSLGQHFLHDETVCVRIVESITRKLGMQLLEIGPGGGALTKYLADWSDVDFRAVEVDREKVAYLLRNYPSLEGRLVEKDILQTEAPFAGPFSIVGNLPYNISSAILFKVLEWGPDVEEVVAMFQKEVAKRIASGPGNKDYGILSVLIGAFYTAEYLFDVPPTAFTPPPEVMSGVLRLKLAGNPYGIADKKPFFRLVKAGFNQRRKTLRNAWRGTLPEEVLLSDPRMTLRAERLTVADFAELAKTYLGA